MNISKNDRATNFANVIDLCNAMIKRGWLETSTIAVIKGVEKNWNGHTLFADYFKSLDLKDNDKKTYTIGDTVFSVTEILAALEAAFRERHAGKYPVVIAGRHRMMAVILLDALFPEKCPVQSGRYTGEGDLPYKRGMRQKIWRQSQLVEVYDVQSCLAEKLDKEAAFSCYTEKGAKGEENTTLTDKATVQDNVANALIEKSKGNKDKVLKGAEIRAAFAMAEKANLAHMVTKVLGAIVANDKGLLEKLVIEALNEK